MYYREAVIRVRIGSNQVSDLLSCFISHSDAAQGWMGWIASSTVYAHFSPTWYGVNPNKNRTLAGNAICAGTRVVKDTCDWESPRWKWTSAVSGRIVESI